MKNRDLLEFSLENIEVVVDQFTASDVIADIPIVGNVVKLISIGSDIRDRIFASKIAKFISCLEEMDESEKKKLKARLSSNPEEAGRVSQALICCIDKSTEIEKSELIACIFVAYIDEKLSESDLRRFAEIIANCFYDDLNAIVEKDRRAFRQNIENLAGTTLVSIEGGMNVDDIGTVDFSLSSLGKKFIAAVKHGRQVIS